MFGEHTERLGDTDLDFNVDVTGDDLCNLTIEHFGTHATDIQTADSLVVIPTAGLSELTASPVT